LVAAVIERARARVPDIDIAEVDVVAEPAVAVKYRVMSTPAIAINGKLEFTGIPREGALLERLRAVSGLPRGTS
jgi:hypothetical protein